MASHEYSEIFGEDFYQEKNGVSSGILQKNKKILEKIFYTRRSDSANVEISSISSGLEEMLAINIVAKDQAFLIDSMVEEMRGKSFNIDHINNSFFMVKRDERGAVQEVSKSGKEGVREVLITFFIVDILSDIELSKLKSRIELILETIHLSIQDWEAMLKKNESIREQQGFHRGLLLCS